MNMHDAAANYVIEPTAIPGIPVAGGGGIFPVHRVYCVGRNYAAHAVEMGHYPDKNRLSSPRRTRTISIPAHSSPVLRGPRMFTTKSR